MIPVLTSEEVLAICIALEAIINGIEKGLIESKDPNLLENLKSALKKNQR